jgi:hypothetical protein
MQCGLGEKVEVRRHIRKSQAKPGRIFVATPVGREGGMARQAVVENA